MKMNKEIVMVRLSDIIPNRFQPRLTFDEEALNELATSIKEHGIIQPLILRDLGTKYEIIAGERRYKASQLAGVEQVPALIGQMDDQTSAELALIENIQRKDLSAIEEAKSYKKILDMGGFTQEELAKRMGKGQSTIANKMRLLTLTNEVQAALMNNLISERHARCLLQIKDEPMQRDVLNKIISERMNVRETDNYIKNLLSIPDKEEKVVEKHPDSYVMSDVNNGADKQELPIIPDIFKNPEKNNFAEEVNVSNEKNQKNENPNVYTQTDNIDFIDLDNLTSPTQSLDKKTVESKEEVKQILDVSVFPNNLEEAKAEKEDEEMPNNIPVIEEQVKDNNHDISKLRLATAIRLVKDAIDDIKTAGYEVNMEEIDKESGYQIIINIQK